MPPAVIPGTAGGRRSGVVKRVMDTSLGLSSVDNVPLVGVPPPPGDPSIPDGPSELAVTAAMAGLMGVTYSSLGAVAAYDWHYGEPVDLAAEEAATVEAQQADVAEWANVALDDYMAGGDIASAMAVDSGAATVAEVATASFEDILLDALLGLAIL